MPFPAPQGSIARLLSGPSHLAPPPTPPLGPTHRVLSSDWLLLPPGEAQPSGKVPPRTCPARFLWSPPAVDALLPSPPLNFPPTSRASFRGPAPARPTSACKTSPTPLGLSLGPNPRQATPTSWLLLLRIPQATRPRPPPDPNSHGGPAPHRLHPRSAPTLAAASPPPPGRSRRGIRVSVLAAVAAGRGSQPGAGCSDFVGGS